MYYLVSDVLAVIGHLPSQLNPCDKVTIVQSLNLTVIVTMVLNFLDFKVTFYYFLPMVTLGAVFISDYQAKSEQTETIECDITAPPVAVVMRFIVFTLVMCVSNYIS